jgi:hypothetical protein
MNSDAISTATQSAIEPTAPQAAPGRAMLISAVACISCSAPAGGPTRPPLRRHIAADHPSD